MFALAIIFISTCCFANTNCDKNLIEKYTSFVVEMKRTEEQIIIWTTIIEEIKKVEAAIANKNCQDAKFFLQEATSLLKLNQQQNKHPQYEPPY